MPEPHDRGDVVGHSPSPPPGHRLAGGGHDLVGHAFASARRSSNHSARAGRGPVTTSTCTAVTLYSGQFVAQSEFSVVTTFAPVTGWWNVV